MPVKKLMREMGTGTQEVFVPLVHPPGEALSDTGSAVPASWNSPPAAEIAAVSRQSPQSSSVDDLPNLFPALRQFLDTSGVQLGSPWIEVRENRPGHEAGVFVFTVLSRRAGMAKERLCRPCGTRFVFVCDPGLKAGLIQKRENATLQPPPHSGPHECLASSAWQARSMITALARMTTSSSPSAISMP